MKDLYLRAIAQGLAGGLAKHVAIKEEDLMTSLEVPKKGALADYAFNVAKLKKFKVNATPELAAELAASWQANEYVREVSSDKVYVNFKINKLPLLKAVVKEIASKGEMYGSSTEGNGQTIVVEYSSPNIAKPFHAGHLRSTIIGNFIKNVHKFLGYKTVGINYLGDWGKQYGLLAVGFARHGDEEKLKTNPIRHLYDVYVAVNKDADADATVHDEARAYFKRMEDGDEEALQLWRKFRDLSIEEYKTMYKRLNVDFDVFSGESLVGAGMADAMKILHEKNICSESKGALIVDLEEEKLGKVLVQKTDGTTLYLTRDISAAVGRIADYNPDKMYYVVGSQQDLHFKQLFTILKKMGYEWSDKLVHINFGMVNGFSTRKGNVVFLEEIINEAKDKMMEVMKSNAEKFADIEDPIAVADIVAISAVVIQDFQGKRHKNYDFNWERMCAFEGFTGPYLQYAHARLMSVERKSDVELNLNANLDLLVEDAAHELADTLEKFPAIVKQSQELIDASLLVKYLFDLSSNIAVGHGALRVKGEEKGVAEARLLLFWCARVVLGTGLKLVGLIPLERM